VYYSSEAGHNLIAEGSYEFHFEPQLGPRAGEADLMTLYLNLNLSPGDTIRVKSAVIQVPILQDGDYNEDGQIDGGDFLLWQQQLAMTGERLAADGDGDGAVGPGDLTVWKDNYPTAAPVASVPEPGAACMIGLALAALAARRGVLR
jgi:hypothetical protein